MTTLMIRLLSLSLMSVMVDSVSIVPRDQDIRTKRGSGARSERRLCEERTQVIAPVVAQNIWGEMRLLVLDEVDKMSDQGQDKVRGIEIVTCAHPGSSCAGCSDRLTGRDTPVMVCSNKYKEVKLKSRGSKSDKVFEDRFMFPDGCDCYTLE